MAKKIKKKNTCFGCGKYTPKHKMVPLIGIKIWGKHPKVCKECLKKDQEEENGRL